MNKRFEFILSTEPFYLILENVIRKILGLLPTSLTKSIFFNFLKRYNNLLNKLQIIYFKFYFTIFTTYNIKILFCCSIEDMPLDWQTRLKNIKYRNLTIEFINDNINFKTEFSKKLNLTEKNTYFIIFNRPAVFVNSGFYTILKYIYLNHKNEIFYTDHKDGIHEKEAILKYKPIFNIEYYLSYNYIQLPLIISQNKLKSIINFNVNGTFCKSWSYEVLLAAFEKKYPITRIENITVLALPFCHKTKSEMLENRKQSIYQYIKRNSLNWKIENQRNGTLYINRPIETTEKVCIIIPFKDSIELLKSCIDSIITHTLYKYYEILLVNNESKRKETYNYLKNIETIHSNINVFEYKKPFNYSEINNYAVENTKCNLLLFLNNDVQVHSIGWLSNMVKHIQFNKVGIVGNLLLYPDKKVQHAGVVIGIGHFAGHYFRNCSYGENGYMNRLICEQELSAVTGACLLTKRSIFEKIGGFNSVHLAVSNNDIALCLEVSKLGFKIIFTPKSILYHLESQSRDLDTKTTSLARYTKEIQFMKKKYAAYIKSGDPFYNINLLNSDIIKY